MAGSWPLVRVYAAAPAKYMILGSFFSVLQATRLAVSRVRPPLAACARVWALRQGPLGRLEAGNWPLGYHMAAAAKERALWSKVGVGPGVSEVVWSAGQLFSGSSRIKSGSGMGRRQGCEVSDSCDNKPV